MAAHVWRRKQSYTQNIVSCGVSPRVYSQDRTTTTTCSWSDSHQNRTSLPAKLIGPHVAHLRFSATSVGLQVGHPWIDIFCCLGPCTSSAQTIICQKRPRTACIRNRSWDFCFKKCFIKVLVDIENELKGETNSNYELFS